jgi:hypothetical protein
LWGGGEREGRKEEDECGTHMSMRGKCEGHMSDKTASQNHPGVTDSFGRVEGCVLPGIQVKGASQIQCCVYGGESVLTVQLIIGKRT